MAIKPLPSPEVLRQLLRYEPETGKLFWLPRGAQWFNATQGRTAAHACANWNARYAGREAFTATDHNGYRCGAILNVNFLAHRVVWAIHYGQEPSGQIDHINGMPHDNRLANMRIASQSENMRNLRRPRNNTSGQVGVTWRKQEAKWSARIVVAGKRSISLGRFHAYEDAVAARKEAEVTFGYHANHGRA